MYMCRKTFEVKNCCSGKGARLLYLDISFRVSACLSLPWIIHCALKLLKIRPV